MSKFKCPQCGSPYFGRDIKEVDGEIVVLDTVRCHGSSSGPRVYGDRLGMCKWRGVWTEESEEEE